MGEKSRCTVWFRIMIIGTVSVRANVNQYAYGTIFTQIHSHFHSSTNQHHHKLTLCELPLPRHAAKQLHVTAKALHNSEGHPYGIRLESSCSPRRLRGAKCDWHRTPASTRGNWYCEVLPNHSILEQRKAQYSCHIAVICGISYSVPRVKRSIHFRLLGNP